MAFTPRLDLKQTQSLVMTPQLQQAIKLLQLSNMELTAFVETELERNPLLVREDGGERTREDAAPAEGGEPAMDGDGTPPPDSAEMVVADRLVDGNEAPLDTDFENSWESEAPSGTAGAGLGRWGGGGFDDGDNSLEQTLERPESLREHLLRQAEMDIVDAGERMLAERLIELVDEAGYLVGDLDGVAAAMGCPRARVLAVLSRLQRLDPPGILARDLRECLALQLADRNRLDPAMETLLDNLDLLARRSGKALMKACGVDAEDLAEMIAEIKALNPKPGLAFDKAVTQTVIPDVLMRPGPDGWIVELNTETLPRVLVDGTYYARVRSAACAKSDRDYIAECFHTANWLIKSLHQRATTILRVASEIVRQQEAFFTKGVEHLRPLVLRNIAEAVEMHESTVSRVTTNKYIATPRGIFELKYFFSFAIASTQGAADHSAESVRARIRRLIESEAGETVLSDDGIAGLLNREGIDIARRTVTKYRESMRIPSSMQRRRDKSMRL